MVVQSIGLVTDLRSQNYNISRLYQVMGQSSEGDGNGGLFMWAASSTAADDGTNIIQVTGTATGRWVRIYSTVTGFVPTSRTITINGVTQDLSADRTWTVGDMLKSVYDTDDDGIVDNAEKVAIIARNSTGATLYKGTIVYLSGSTGNRPNAVKAQANSELTSSGTFGVVVSDIANNSDGQVAALGTLHDLDTRSNATHPFTSDTLLDGDVVWLDPTTAGFITKTKPTAPNHAVYIGIVARTHPTLGRIVYRIVNGFELNELHNVSINSVANNDGLFYESSTSLWKNKSIATVLGYTPADAALVVPNTRTLTINGTTYDLSANRSWTIDALPSQSGNAGKYLTTDGTNASWGSISTSNIYNSDGTLTADRTVTMNNFKLYFEKDIYVYNIRIGRGEGANQYNTVVGLESLLSNTTGWGNTAIGWKSLSFNTTGTSNTAIGVVSLYKNTTGVYNTSVGYNNLPNNTTGNQNTSIGFNSMFSNVSGGNNTTIGYQSLMNVTTGSNNTIVGYNSGRGITTGSHNTIIGGGILGLSSSLSNNIIIADGQSNMRLVIDNNGNAVIGSTSYPSLLGYRLDVLGTGRFTGSTSAITGSAIGVTMTNTLVATADNDTLVGLDINPTFTNGAFANVTNLAARFLGTIRSISSTSTGVDISTNPSANNGGTIIQYTTSNTKYSTTSFYNSSNALGASFGYGDSLVTETWLRDAFIIGARTSGGKLIFVRGAAATQSMTMFSTGNLLIQDGGTHSDATYKLDVQGTFRSSNYAYINYDGNDGMYIDKQRIYRNYYGNVFGNINFASVTVPQLSATVAVVISGQNSSDAYYSIRNYDGGLNINYFGASPSTLSLNAALQVDSTTRGFLPTVMTSAQKSKISLGVNTISITAGSGYTNGTYTDQGLIGGSGYGAKATIVISGGSIISATITRQGVNYVVGDQLVLPSYIWGSGTGGYLTVTSVYSPSLGLQTYQSNSTEGYYVNTSLGWKRFLTEADGNIYTTDGTLAANRTVTMSGNWLSFSGGNVGIGVTSPTVKLQLVGGEMVLSDGAVTGTVGNGNISITGTSGSLNVFKRGVTNLASTTAGDRWAFYADSVGFHFWTGTTADTNIIFPTGNWKIGGDTTDSGYKLDVQGTFKIGVRPGVGGQQAITFTYSDVYNTIQSASWTFLQSTYGLFIGAGNGQSVYLGTNNADQLSDVAIGYVSWQAKNASAILDIKSTTKGFLGPRMTNAQLTAISTPAVGLQAYKTDATEGQYVNTSAGWKRFLTESDGPAGSNTQIQYNNAGAFGASATFTYSPTSYLYVAPSVTASGAIAQGSLFSPTLTAAANNDVLVGLDINPTFTNGAFTGISNYAARFQNNILVSKNQNAVTSLTISNTTSGTGSHSRLILTSDTSSGQAVFSKNSTLGSGYKFFSVKDLVVFNDSTGGNISIINDYASGSIQFGAGGSNTAHFIIASNGDGTYNGNYTVSKNQNGQTFLSVSNTTAGTASFAGISLVSDSGSFNSFKTSSTYTTYKIINGGDAGFYNGTSSGDFSFMNDYASGKFKWAMGGSTTAQMTLTAAGRLLLGTTTESTYLLDVNGTGRFTGRLNIDTSINFPTAPINIEIGGSTALSVGSNYIGIGTNGAQGYLMVNNGSFSIGTFKVQSGTYKWYLGGKQVGYSLTTGDNIVAFGHEALFGVTTGSNHIALGTYAGAGTSRGNTGNHSNGIFLGNATGAQTDTTTLSNITIIGHEVRTNLSNVFMLGRYDQTIMIGQGTSVGSGAILQIDSTTKGFLPPRMTSAERTAISTPAVGLIVYQTDGTEGTYEYISTGWRIINGVSSNIYTSDGTLAGNRTVTMSGYNLNFTGGNVSVGSAASSINSFEVNVANKFSGAFLGNLGGARTPSQSYGIHLGWNYSGGSGESNFIWGTGGVYPYLVFSTWNGTTKSDVVEFHDNGLINFKYYTSATSFTGTPAGYLAFDSAGNLITTSGTGGGGGTGTVTTVSVVSANGFAGTVANATTTPAITLTTSITGVLKGNGTAISAAVLDTDYVSKNIYTADGTLGGNRTITMSGNYLNFTGGNIGIGVSSPTAKFEVASSSSTSSVGFNIGTSSSPERGNMFYYTDGTGWKFNIGKYQGSTFTPQMTFVDNGCVLIGTTSANGNKFEVNGDGYIHYSSTWTSGSSQAFAAVNDTTYASGSSLTNGYFYGGLYTSDSSTYNGNQTVPSGAVVAGTYVSKQVYFNSAGLTITMNQGTGGSPRAFASNITQLAFNTASTTGTITHAAGIQVLGIYKPSGAVATITNYYGLLMNDSSEYSTYVSVTNKWGIYQVGTNDRNYFAGRVLIGTTSDAGSYNLQITGQLRLNSYTSTSSYTGVVAGYLAFDASGNILTTSTPSGGGYTVVSQTSTYNVTATSGTLIVLCDTTSGAFSVNLPTAVGNSAVINIKRTAGNNQLSIDGAGTETIDGQTILNIDTIGRSVTLISNGTNWFII